MGKTHKQEKEFKPKGRTDLHKSREQDWYNERFLPDVFDDEYDDDIDWEEYNGKNLPTEKNSNNKRTP